MLFHRDIYVPNEINEIFDGKTFCLVFSHHALVACLTDRYGQINPPKSLTVKSQEIIKVEIEENKVNKLVVRISYNSAHDLLIAFIPNPDGSATVKTCWLNRTDDKHRTLDTKRYLTKSQITVEC